MGAERFIEKLAEQQTLPESVIKRLRDKVASSSSVPSAKALARFLIDKGHLTREQADEALKAATPPRRPKTPKSEKSSSPSKSTIKQKKIRTPRAKSKDPFSSSGGEEGGDAKSSGKKKKKNYKKKKKGENEFDTPLMLLGSGGLILLLLCVGGITWLLFSESGDDRLKSARAAFESGSYGQAIQEYKIFLDKFSGHEGESEARVNLAVAQIRKVVGTNHELALEAAQQHIPGVTNEEEFPAIQEDIASLLPKIAKGLSAKADKAEALEDIRKYTQLSEEALEMYESTEFVPNRYRNKQELSQIRALLARIGLRQIALESLQATIEEMNSSTASGDAKTAYASHAAFVREHPEKANDPELLAAIAAASEAEQAGIKFEQDGAAGLTTEAKTSVKASVAPADRRRKGSAPANGLCVVQVQGGAYGFDRKDGKLRWRRPLGSALEDSEPVILGDDCLLVNNNRKELVRVNASTNKLVWRAPLDDVVTQPTVAGGLVLAAGQSGKLHVVEAKSGKRLGHVQFAQPLRSSPVADPKTNRIYLVGEHSSVYTLDAKDFSCLGVYYLGHAKGTVVAPPQVVLNRLIILENDGATTSRLHVLGLDDQNVVDRELLTEDQSQTRLAGLVKRAPVVFGKRFATTTNSGHIAVYEVSAENDEVPISLLAIRPAGRQPRSQRFSAVVNQDLWIAGAGLSRYSIQPSGKRLPGRDIVEPFRGDTFVHPLRVADGVVIHVRRRRGRAGATVAASDLKTGDVYWETDIAAPAAGPPVSANDSGDWLYATGSGRVFLVDQAALERGVTDRVVAGREGAASLLDAGAASPRGAVYASSGSGFAVGVSNGDSKASVRPLELPSRLTCPPSSFASGWLAGLAIGQVFYFDSKNGDALAAPFQPELTPRANINWSQPAVGVQDGKPMAVVSDGANRLFSLELAERPAPNLFLLASYDLKDSRFSSRVALVGETAAVANSSGSLMLFNASTLELTGEADLGSSVAWGPFAVAERFVLATANGRLVAIAPDAPDTALWSTKVESTQLAGAPRLDGESLLISLRRGLLESRSLDSGEVLGRLNFGQSITGGAQSLDGQLLLAAHDGALLIVDQTERR